MESIMKESSALGVLIAGIDLSNTRNRLVTRHNYSTEAADRAIAEYRNFLFNCGQNPTQKLSPSKVVDDVWHDHILHLRQYIDDCTRVFGRIIYHNPFPVESSSDATCDAWCGIDCCSSHE